MTKGDLYKQKEVNIMGAHNCCKNRTEECVGEKVYKSWKKNRRKHGNDLDYWFDAEINVMGSVEK